MINQIKDKQTGEYHDIGGLKCKLVAEGTLAQKVDSPDFYNPIYNFEEGKTYFIFVESEGDWLQFIGTFFEGQIQTQFVPDWAFDGAICLIATKNYTALMDYQFYPYNIRYIESEYKIYELPFALEV